jgi:hypothetical protein
LMGIVSLTLCFDFSSKFLFSFLMCCCFSAILRCGPLLLL